MAYFETTTQQITPVKIRLELGHCGNVIQAYDPGSFQLALFSSPYPEQRGFTVKAADFTEWLDQEVGPVIQALNPVTGVLAHNIAFKRRESGAYDLRVFDVARYYEQKGLHCIQVTVWDKKNPAPGGPLARADHAGFEWLFIFGRSPAYTWRPEFRPYARKTVLKAQGAAGMRKTAVDGRHSGNGAELAAAGARQDSIFRYSSTGGEKRPRAAGGSWPGPLAGRLIRQYSDPGDWIVDPFCGAGTSLIEAIRAGRHGLGIDVSIEALALAQEWISLESIGLKWGDRLPIY